MRVVSRIGRLNLEMDTISDYLATTKSELVYLSFEVCHLDSARLTW